MRKNVKKSLLCKFLIEIELKKWYYYFRRRCENMLNVERYNMILEILDRKRNVSLQELVERLDTSEATVRRDLNFLEKAGKLKRIHGGAVLVQEREEDIVYKNITNQDSKEIIAKRAVEYVKNGDIIYLDAGSTTHFLIKYLRDKKGIKVVTNGYTHIQELMDLGIETYLLGGKLKKKTGAIVGQMTAYLLEKYNFDVVFIGANGMSKFGYSTPDLEEVMVKRQAIRQGKRVYFLCDSSKYNKKSFINFATPDEGVLISND